MKFIALSVTALTLIMSPIISARAACSLTVVKSSPKAKSVTLNGVTIGAKQLAALAQACTITTREPSLADRLAKLEASHAKRIAKLKASGN